MVSVSAYSINVKRPKWVFCSFSIVVMVSFFVAAPVRVVSMKFYDGNFLVFLRYVLTTCQVQCGYGEHVHDESCTVMSTSRCQIHCSLRDTSKLQLLHLKTCFTDA